MLALAALALHLSAATASASIAGHNVVGSTDYPDGGMRRVSALTLSDDLYSHLYSAAYDGTRYGYFASSHGGWVIKVDLAGPTPVEVGATQCLGAGNMLAGVVDAAAGYAYFGAVAKIKLDDGSGKPQCLGALNLVANVGGIVIDTSDPDPTKHDILLSTFGSPAVIYKIAPGAGDALPTLRGTVTLDGANGENAMRRVVLDARDPVAANHAAIFAPIALNGAPVVFVKVAYGAGANPVRVGASTPDPGDHAIGSAVIDPAAGFAYFGTYQANDANGAITARVIQVALGATGQAPQRVAHRTLVAGEALLSSAVADAPSHKGYFSCDLTYPAHVYKIDFDTFSEMQDLPLHGGTQSPTPPTGVNDFDTPETKYGEVFVQSSIVDPATGYAYFGTDSDKGQVVKVAMSPKGAIHASRVDVPTGAAVRRLAFFAHMATGNLRLAVYDAARNALWQSPSFAATSGWNFIDVPAGALVVPAGTYWLAWQTDSGENVASWLPGAAGDGWALEQAFGPFAPSAAAAVSNGETWSAYLEYLDAADALFADGYE